MDDFDLPEDLQDVEVIYSDGEDEDEGVEDMAEDDDTALDDVEVEDGSVLTFIKHSSSIFSSDLSKNSLFAVTGGQDDTAYVWSTATGEIILECTGHKDSVSEVSFNHDNQLVATGDMAGMIQVWSLKDRKLIWCFEIDDMEWLTWHPIADILISGCKSGEIYIWQVPQGNCKVLATHGAACTSGRILPDGKRLVAGYGDGQIKLWDIKATSTIWQVSETNDNGVLSLEVNGDGTLVSVAPSSQLLKIADGKLIKSLLVQGETEIENHVFDDKLNVLITGAISGQLAVWDLAKQVIRHQVKIESAVTVIKLGPNGNPCIGAADGNVYYCDVRTGTLLETFTGHRAEILSLSVSCDGSFVLTTSDDGTAKIFKIKS